jgi:hypothetical protein
MVDNVYHFYHIYAEGNWKDPIDQHVKALKKSGLYEVIKTLKIGLVGRPERIQLVKDYLLSMDINFEVVAESPTGWEQTTQIPLRDFAQSNDGYVLYAHTKGAHSQQHPNIPWRETMIHFNVLKWEECIEALKDHDTAGCFWIPSAPNSPEHSGHNGFYGGTFWWTTLKFIRTLPEPMLDHRWRAEGWIGIRQHVDGLKPFSFLPGSPGNYVTLDV